jgi:hypothetical protein
MKSFSISSAVRILGVSALLLLAGSGASFAGEPTPELDPGSVASGIALAVGAAVLMAERYRRRN